MSSGVQASQECQDTYSLLKTRKGLKYIVFALSPDNKEIIVEKSGEKAGDEKDAYDAFCAILKGTPGPPQCRWGIYDLEFEKGEDGKRSKICFFAWAPDDARIKEKMLYASSKDALRKSLVGIQLDIQGADVDDIEFETVLEKANRGH